MTPDLMARVCNQALDYGELMLTIEEFGAWWKFTNEHPHATIMVGPGQIRNLSALSVFVLAP